MEVSTYRFVAAVCTLVHVTCTIVCVREVYVLF